jgi:integrase
MARLLAIAGLNRELTPHSLRHTHTSLLAEAGVSIEQIWTVSGILMIQLQKMFISMERKK